MKKPASMFVILATLLCTSVLAVELRAVKVRTGTEGLTAARVLVTNRSDRPIVCNAQLAHWYSLVLLQVAAGATEAIDFWREPETGTVSVLNVKSENMPVESVWCGLAGRAYASRSALVLDHILRPGPEDRSVTCDEQNSRLVCR